MYIDLCKSFHRHAITFFVYLLSSCHCHVRITVSGDYCHATTIVCINITSVFFTVMPLPLCVSITSQVFTVMQTTSCVLIICQASTVMNSSSEQLLVYGQKPAASVGTVIVREAVQPRPSTANPQRVWETCHADQSYKVNKRVRNI